MKYSYFSTQITRLKLILDNKCPLTGYNLNYILLLKFRSQIIGNRNQTTSLFKISVKRVLNNGNQQGVVVQGAVGLSFWVDIAVSLAFIDGVNFIFSFFFLENPVFTVENTENRCCEACYHCLIRLNHTSFYRHDNDIHFLDKRSSSATTSPPKH